jgi:hypothetical protein
VTNDAEQLLEKINEVSRQLLSRILDVQKKIKENIIITNESDNNESKTVSLITDNELTELISKRDRLIRSLFKQKTTDEIAQEYTILNKMVLLDTELSSQFQACKQILSKQVMKIKKSKKAAKSYQKY